jgi:hypothetical protein
MNGGAFNLLPALQLDDLAVFLLTDQAKWLIGAREMTDLEIAEAAAGAVKTGTGHEPSNLIQTGYQRSAGVPQARSR